MMPLSENTFGKRYNSSLCGLAPIFPYGSYIGTFATGVWIGNASGKSAARGGSKRGPWEQVNPQVIPSPPNRQNPHSGYPGLSLPVLKEKRVNPCRLTRFNY
jgi:hypothetical protein